MSMVIKSPNAMASTVISPVVKRTMPFIMLLSNKSVNEFINATPGTKYKIEVAKAVWGCVPILNITPKPAINEATNEPTTIRIYTLNFSLWVN